MNTKGQRRRLAETDAAPPGVPRLVTIAGRCYDLTGASCVLRCGPADVMKELSHRRLLAFDDAQNRYLFPVWQFPHGHRLPHLADVLGALAYAGMDPLTMAMWFTRGRRELDGACVAGWLQWGDPDAVLALTSKLGHNGHAAS